MIASAGDGHGHGVDRSVLEAARCRGVTERGDLSRFNTGGKLLGVGGEVWREGVVAGELGVGGGDGGVGVVVAAGEQTGEEASEAKGGYFQEAAFGARRRQERHELSSRRYMVMNELRQGYRGASGATMTRSREGNEGGLEIGLLWVEIDNKEVVGRVLCFLVRVTGGRK